MKKQLTILLLFLFTSPFAWSQDKYIKTTSPCDSPQLRKTPGRWMPPGNYFHSKITKTEEQEVVKRLAIIQKMAFDINPQPIAFDVMQGYHLAVKEFAPVFEIEKLQYGTRQIEVKGYPALYYAYSIQYCNYFCSSDGKQIIRGNGCETGTYFSVTMNTLDAFYFPNHLDDATAEIMRIDNRPIKQFAYLVGKWQGYDYYNNEGVTNPKIVLLYREGQLPYIPVTRKQYLDRCINALEISLNKNIIPFEKREGLQLLMKKEEWDAQNRKMEKMRDDVLKYYRDELAATTRAGLLDSPAIVANGFMNIITSVPVFNKGPLGGQMLVTENPAYFKKDLPKYIPQFMVVYIVDAEERFGEHDPYKMYEQKMSIDKLKEMIDK